MTTIAEPPAASIYRADERRELTLLVPTMIEADPFGTSDHIGFSIDCRLIPDTRRTTWVASGRSMIRTLSVEVERLRDIVSAITGLTRQEIARAIGVDRRSLSGFVSGEIRPTQRRLHALRVLADTAEWAAEQFGEHAREIFRGADPDTSPLSLIAAGKTDIRRELRAIARQTGVTNENDVTTRLRATKEPLYVKAATAWAAEGNLPTRQGVPRDASENDQDLSKAIVAVAVPERPRRGAI